jgi:hypothetical protein
MHPGRTFRCPACTVNPTLNWSERGVTERTAPAWLYINDMPIDMVELHTETMRLRHERVMRLRLHIEYQLEYSCSAVDPLQRNQHAHGAHCIHRPTERPMAAAAHISRATHTSARAKRLQTVDQ